MGVYLGDWQLGDPEIGSPAAVTTVGTQAASVGTPSDPEEEARKQRGMFDNATVESRFMSELAGDQAARDAAAAEAQRAADESAVLGKYTQVNSPGARSMASPVLNFQSQFIDQNLPGYYYAQGGDENPRGWFGPEELQPYAVSDTDIPPYDYVSDVEQALQGATMSDVNAYWDAQREQAATNAYSAPHLGAWAVPIAVQLVDARRKQIEQPS